MLPGGASGERADGRLAAPAAEVGAGRPVARIAAHQTRRPPAVWVCAVLSTAHVEVRVGGAVPALVPLLPGGGGLPVAADVGLAREVFR